MNKDNVIVSISDYSNIEKIADDTKYINIAIDKNLDNVPEYFIDNGKDYLYGDIVNERRGFIYTNFNNFKMAEIKIKNIISSVPEGLEKREIVRYVYISLGKQLCLDINLMENKNNALSFGDLSLSNNIWGAMSTGKVTDKSCAKLLTYILMRLGIKSELVSTNINGNVANKIFLDDTSFLIVDLFNDIHNIAGNFTTLHFDKYNDDIDLDRKIGYIKDNYVNHYIDDILSKSGDVKGNILYKFLSLTERLINISKIGTMELSLIYKDLFKKYFSNYDIKINNFYVYEDSLRDHFILISYNKTIYSFNYQKNKFVNINVNDIIGNLESNMIGIYDNEDFDLKEDEVTL